LYVKILKWAACVTVIADKLAAPILEAHRGVVAEHCSTAVHKVYHARAFVQPDFKVNCVVVASYLHPNPFNVKYAVRRATGY
jgi:hypothetical protein